MELVDILKIFAVIAAVALVLAAVVLTYAIRKLNRIRLPADADFFTAVRAVPLSLVIGLDLLDLALDVFSAPIIWVILNRAGLQALRNTAAIEALIPITGPIPTLTIAWGAARLFNLGRAYDPDVIETQQVGPNEYAPRPGTR
ncbi:MAG: hypothetical protein QOH06_533 [Acidobacteriota bacterium]|jgi:hypothetical protein|nr:hypothetical protein [Acidobacteriota bacterium]